MEDLLEIFCNLPVPAGSSDFYSAQSLNQRSNYRVAKDSDGNAALLIAPLKLSGDSVLPVQLRNLSFRPRCVCRVHASGCESVENLAVLKCTTDDVMLRDYFLRTLSGMLLSLPTVPTETDITAAVARLVELFRALESPPSRSLQGLWCELYLIGGAKSIRQTAKAWHADIYDLYDFVSGRQRIEVKSTLGPHRIHHFRLEQLLPQQGIEVVIVSFVLKESVTGVSITDLWDEVSARNDITPGLIERLSKILTLSLGRDWREAQLVKFDRVTACQNVRLYDTAMIPKIDSCLPSGVSEVRFKSELTDVTPLSLENVVSREGLFEAMFG